MWPATTGRDGIVLVRGNNGYLLFDGSKLVASGKLKTILAQQRRLVARAFGPRRCPGRSEVTGTWVTADAKGNIWLVEGENMSVLIGKRWVDAAKPLVAAGSRLGRARFVAAVGDGSKVYLSDLLLLHDKGRSFVGEIKNGELLFTDAPHAAHGNDFLTGLRDDDGGLWVAGTICKGMQTCDAIFGQISVRFGRKDAAEKYTNAGWPLLIDQAGNVWLGRIRGQPENKLNVWRGGRIVQTLELPNTDKVWALHSDKPGSVYAWTTLGITWLKADGPDFAHFRPGKTYAVPVVPGRPTLIAYSEFGYLVATSYTDYPRKHYLHLIRIPEL
jgi:hypothetical protein